MREATGCASPDLLEEVYEYYSQARAWHVTPGAVDALQEVRSAGMCNLAFMTDYVLSLVSAGNGTGAQFNRASRGGMGKGGREGEGRRGKCSASAYPVSMPHKLAQSICMPANLPCERMPAASKQGDQGCQWKQC